MQWQDEVALIRNGKVRYVLSGIGSLGVLPQIHCVSPLCISNQDTATLEVSGSNIATEGCSVLCRHQGRPDQAGSRVYRAATMVMHAFAAGDIKHLVVLPLASITSFVMRVLLSL